MTQGQRERAQEKRKEEWMKPINSGQGSPRASQNGHTEALRKVLTSTASTTTIQQKMDSSQRQQTLPVILYWPQPTRNEPTHWNARPPHQCWVHHTRQQQVDPPAALQKSTVVFGPGQKLRLKKSWLTTRFPNETSARRVWFGMMMTGRSCETTFTLKITSEQKKVDKEIHMEALTFVKVLGLLPNPFRLFGLFPSVPPFCVKSPSVMLFPLFILVTCV